MGLLRTENLEIKTHFDEKWNYEHRLFLVEGCIFSKRSAFQNLEVNPLALPDVTFN